MSEAKHSPTPWTFEKHITFRIIGNDRYHICNMTYVNTKQADANAAHIVKCVNLHERLVEALQDFLNGLDSGMIYVDSPADEILSNCLGKIRNALAKAREE